MDIGKWLKQPTTVTGIGLLFGLIAAVIAYALTRDPVMVTVIGVLIAALVHMAMPDNSAEAAAMQKLVSDAVRAAIERRLAGSMPLLASDAQAAVAAAVAPAVPAPAAAPVAAVAGPAAALLALVLTAGALSACSQSQVDAFNAKAATFAATAKVNAHQALQVGCQIDQTWQPLLMTGGTVVAPMLALGGQAPLAGELQLVMQGDAAMVHPAVVQFCKDHGGTPAPAPTAAPAAQPVAAS